MVPSRGRAFQSIPEPSFAADSWPAMKVTEEENSRCVRGIFAAAAHPIAAVIPGTISKGIPEAARHSASSPPRPKTNGSPDFRRTTVFPSGRHREREPLAFYDRGRQESAVVRRIRHVHRNPPPTCLPGNRPIYAGIGSGGEYDRHPVEVLLPESLLDQADHAALRQLEHRGGRLGSDDGHKGAAPQEGTDLPQGDPARPRDESRCAFRKEEDREIGIAVFHPFLTGGTRVLSSPADRAGRFPGPPLRKRRPPRRLPRPSGGSGEGGRRGDIRPPFRLPPAGAFPGSGPISLAPGRIPLRTRPPVPW